MTNIQTKLLMKKRMYKLTQNYIFLCVQLMARQENMDAIICLSCESWSFFNNEAETQVKCQKHIVWSLGKEWMTLRRRAMHPRSAHASLIKK